MFGYQIVGALKRFGHKAECWSRWHLGNHSIPLKSKNLIFKLSHMIFELLNKKKKAFLPLHVIFLSIAFRIWLKKKGGGGISFPKLSFPIFQRMNCFPCLILNTVFSWLKIINKLFSFSRSIIYPLKVWVKSVHWNNNYSLESCVCLLTIGNVTRCLVMVSIRMNWGGLSHQINLHRCDKNKLPYATGNASSEIWDQKC